MVTNFLLFLVCVVTVAKAGLAKPGENQLFYGFQPDVSPVQTACEDKPEIITSPSGNISSTNYPDQYPPGENCGWRFEAPEGTRVRLTIDDLETEDCCTCDYVVVYDGDDFDVRRFGLWFDNDKPPVITSSNNVLYVEFISDFSDNDFRGFLATYEHV